MPLVSSVRLSSKLLNIRMVLEALELAIVVRGLGQTLSSGLCLNFAAFWVDILRSNCAWSSVPTETPNFSPSLCFTFLLFLLVVPFIFHISFYAPFFFFISSLTPRSLRSPKQWFSSTKRSLTQIIDGEMFAHGHWGNQKKANVLKYSMIKFSFSKELWKPHL